MREDNRCWRNGAQAMQPVRTAVDHDSIVIFLNKQRAVMSVQARSHFYFAARSKECQAHSQRLVDRADRSGYRSSGGHAAL